MTERNWSGTYEYGARCVRRPSTVEELQEVVAGARSIRAVASRHSFNGIPDAAELVSLERLPAEIEVDRARSCVSLGGAARYADVVRVLRAEGLALHNLASLPHISVAGAVATATHGSGDRSGNLATAVRAVTLVRSDGEVVQASGSDPDFDGLVVGLGGLGIVTRLTLEVEPAYEVTQHVYEHLPWSVLLERFDAVMASGDSVSAFSRLDGAADQVWVKRRVDDGRAEAPEDLFGARASRGPRHPIAGMDPANATQQLGVAGPWWDRLPHFRMGFVPSSGAEIQSEYLVGRDDATAALEAVRGIAAVITPLLQVCEIRTIARDGLWMSPQHARDSVGIHFTWHPDPPAVDRALARIEAALAPYAPRPHWGKAFLMEAATVAERYERLEDFRRLAGRLDPRGAFRNRWLDRHVLGGRV